MGGTRVRVYPIVRTDKLSVHSTSKLRSKQCCPRGRKRRLRWRDSMRCMIPTASRTSGASPDSTLTVDDPRLKLMQVRTRSEFCRVQPGRTEPHLKCTTSVKLPTGDS